MLAALSAGSVAAAAEAAPIGLSLGGPPARPGAAPGVDLARGTLADWSALVGRRFRLAGAAGAPLKLVAIEPLVSDGPRPASVVRRRGFAAVFESSAARAPEGDRTHVLALGLSSPLPLFLSPPSEVSGKSRLVAVFN
jgi:hypothetical protein